MNHRSRGIVLLAVLALVVLGACLVHVDADDSDDHGLAPHGCAAMVIAGLMAGSLARPSVSRAWRLEAVASLYYTLPGVPDPPPKRPSFA
jgi:hypothetical protein